VFQSLLGINRTTSNFVGQPVHSQMLRLTKSFIPLGVNKWLSSLAADYCTQCDCNSGGRQNLLQGVGLMGLACCEPQCALLQTFFFPVTSQFVKYLRNCIHK
jgi:hypothetical protein